MVLDSRILHIHSDKLFLSCGEFSSLTICIKFYVVFKKKLKIMITFCEPSSYVFLFLVLFVYVVNVCSSDSFGSVNALILNAL